MSGGTSNLSDQVIATGTATLYEWLAEWNTTTVPNSTYTLPRVASYAGGLAGTSAGISATIAQLTETSGAWISTIPTGWLAAMCRSRSGCRVPEAKDKS